MDNWVNTTTYSTLELVLFGLGCVLWAVTYVDVLVAVRRAQFVEIPSVAVMANVAWEFDWGFVLQTDMGMLFQWGYRIWFFLDVVIVWAMIRFTFARIDVPQIKRLAMPATAVFVVLWGVGLYFLREQGVDNPTGAVSGYILNVMMSGLYLWAILTTPTPHLYSPLSAWCKGLGTGLISVFCVLHLPENRFLLTLCGTAALLDALYLTALYRRRDELPALAV
ncbi:MAG: hypothetical protein EXR79_16790 [Myxococcales bacterium]|nr:hypothetical protein [Myxococcales bacterium]